MYLTVAHRAKLSLATEGLFSTSLGGRPVENRGEPSQGLTSKAKL